MYWYLIEVFEWVINSHPKYYHLVDSKIFHSKKNLKEQTYSKNNKFYTLSKISPNEA